MTPGFFEWVVRTAMLVLAGLVTLSILGSIAAMSNDAAAPPGAGEAAPVRPAPGPETVPRASEAPTPEPGEVAEAGAGGAAPGTAAEGAAIAAAPPPAEDRLARWLEAISYALLALAGLAAIGLLLFWRAARQLRRIAEALEARPRP